MFFVWGCFLGSCFSYCSVFFFEYIIGLIEMVDCGSEGVCGIKVIVIYIKFKNVVEYGGYLFFVCIFFIGD